MYSIDSLAEILGVTRHTIHNWRKAGVLPPPKGGRRYAMYDATHVKWGAAAKKLIHDNKVTLADLAERRRYIEAGSPDA